MKLFNGECIALLFYWKKGELKMIKITESEEKITAPKKTIKLDNISVKDLKLVDAETGEDLSQQVIDAIPFDQIGFKITFELPVEEDSES